MLPGESYATAVRASLGRLGPGWSVVRGDSGIPLDESGSLRLLREQDGEDGLALDEVAQLTEVVARARAAVAAAVAAAARPAEGERALPTALGGPAAWHRAVSAAVTAGAGLDDPHGVVVIRTDLQSDRAAERTAAALLRSVRAQDAVCLLRPGSYAVLALCCSRDSAAELADRLVTALLDVGIGAATGAASDTDPRRAQPLAEARAEEAWRGRSVLRP